MALKSKSQRRRDSKRRAQRKEARMENREVVSEDKSSAKLVEKKERSAEKQSAKQSRLVVALRSVAAELHRVTWPTREDVTKWSAVTVSALVFFGLYVAGLDSLVSMALVGFTSLVG